MNTIFRKTNGLTCVLAAISIVMLTISPALAMRTMMVQAMAGIVTNGAVVREWSETANGHVPFKAIMSGSAAFTGPATVEFHGTGHATHLGRFVGSGVAVLGESTGSCHGGFPNVPNVPNVHTETLIAANGDELVIRLVNVGCPTGPFTFRGIGHWTVLSGTGRFQDVTGQGTNEGHADFESNTFELALTGTLFHQ